jgi:hypothetical protein
MRLHIPANINAVGLNPFLAQLGSLAELEPEIVLDFSTVRRGSPGVRGIGGSNPNKSPRG